MQERIAQAEAFKRTGNEFFNKGHHTEAIAQYEQALEVAPADASERAIYFANKAACHLSLEEYKSCVDSCVAALGVKPDYVKAIRRKMTAHEKLDELEHALEDAKKVGSASHLFISVTH
jgi:tetratricopeptide (TPR) repeat protein